MAFLGFEPEELRRLIVLREEMLRLTEKRHDRPRRILAWLKWRRRAEAIREQTISRSNDP